MWRRLGGLGLSLAALAVVVVAFALEPSPSGWGTHRALGLPPCTFRATTGIPCPSCGLTTSFAALAHGDVGLALSANPLGLLLFLLVVMSVPGGLWLAVRNVPLAEVFYNRWFDRVALVLVALWLGTWALRLSLGASP